jgi:hypothetical protein
MIKVWTDAAEAGLLDRHGERGSTFAYLPGMPDARAVSVTMPLRLPSCRGREGASSAAKNAFHCTAPRRKVCRSASTSLARCNALTSTNSLSEQCATAAADCKACLAPRVIRKLSFSLRLADVQMFLQ